MELIRFSSILHPTDFSAADNLAVVHALKVALVSQAKLTLLHVVPKGDRVEWEEYPQTREMLAAWGVISPEASHADVLNTGLSVRKSLRKGDNLAKEIAGEVRKDGTDLVVLSSGQHGGLKALVRRPVAEAIARRVVKPVLFVPRDGEGFVDEATGAVRMKHILIPTSKLPSCKRVLEVAGSLAAVLTREPVRFTLLFVGDEFDQPKIELPVRAGWEFSRVCREGKVVPEILTACDEGEVDLIAMATAGSDGFRDSMRGTTVEQILRGAPCPLLSIPVKG